MPTDRQAVPVLAKATLEPGNPMALAACLGVIRSRRAVARSIRLLDWLRVLGLPAASLEQQRNPRRRTLATFEHRDRVVGQTGPCETGEIAGGGPVRFRTANGHAACLPAEREERRRGKRLAR